MIIKSFGIISLLTLLVMHLCHASGQGQPATGMTLDKLLSMYGEPASIDSSAVHDIYTWRLTAPRLRRVPSLSPAISISSNGTVTQNRRDSITVTNEHCDVMVEFDGNKQVRQWSFRGEGCTHILFGRL